VSRAWTLRFAVCALVSLAAVALAVRVSSAAPGTAPPLRGVNFISVCGFSHRGPDDPIVLPRQPGYSHDHTFVGNESTNAFSTPAQLRSAGTTCRRPGDKAAYWMPTLFVGGEAVTPTTAIAYYRRLARVPIKPFPAGLQMVAGNQSATTPQKLVVTYWDCGDLVNIAPSSSVPDCADGALSLHVNFPDCWDGKNLLYAKQHNTVYSVNGRCPRDHPVALPALSLVFRYPVKTPAGTVELASGGQFSGHADFINAWDQQVLATLVASCLNTYRHCGTGS
jgi:Domain of unknown function (DUF1996)